MALYNINKLDASNYTDTLDTYEVSSMTTDGAGDQDETEWYNNNWSTQWGYFLQVPDLKSAILMKAMWLVGKGYNAYPEYNAILNGITGYGKETFLDILYNMVCTMIIGGDSFAEIIRDNESGEIINLKVLDPGSIKVIRDRSGMIKRYEQVAKVPKSGMTKIEFKPNQIFHLSNNTKLADQIHGISAIDSVESIILADQENFTDVTKLMHRQIKPFIIFKLKTDDEAVISQIVSKVTSVRNKGDDLFIPDDENILSYEVVQVNPSALIFSWRDDIRNKFYRTIGLPQIVPGGSGQSTESESKVIYLAFEQINWSEQLYIENQIWNQLAIRVNLIHPASIKPDLDGDSNKDAMQGFDFQPADFKAGKAR
jgi:hypothetical protein